MQNKEILLKRINTALDEIRPYLKDDGGDVEVVDITDDYILKIKLLGACGTCNMSTMTVSAGIEGAVRGSVPEIVSVESIN
jgi:Fe-S cluster biogenesis protein NfuA